MSVKFNITILIAPLDWGLGHATRCIPIVQYLLDKGCKVLLAAEGPQQALLQKEFPTVEILTLKGYRIQYSKNKRLFALKILQQVPKILSSIQYERKWLAKVVDKYKIDAVISDNRYGLNGYNIRSIFITHQLVVQAPIKLLEQTIQNFNYRLIKKFTECWIPDEKGAKNIAGNLSHPKKLPGMPVHYLGGISRLNKSSVETYKYKFLAVISGPEPQRYLLEQKIFNQLKNFSGHGLIVRGLPGSGELVASFGSVRVVNHLTAKELETAFNESEFIISRSGYTTLMDILKLRKKSILIPTPGQTEQEYLGVHWQKQQWALSVKQEVFNLPNALKAAEKFEYYLPTLNMESYKVVIDNFINSI